MNLNFKMENLKLYMMDTSYNSFDRYISILSPDDFRKSPLRVNRLGYSRAQGVPLGADEIPDLRYFIATKRPLDFEDRFNGLDIGFFISPKAHDLLSGFNISGYHFIESPYLFKKVPNLHYYLFLYEDMWRSIVIEKTKFAIVKDISLNEGIIIEDNLTFFSDKDVYWGKVEGGKRLITKEDLGGNIISHYSILFKKTVKDLDLFPVYKHSVCSWRYKTYYVSERLKDAIESAGLTGITFKECNAHYVES